MSCANSYVHCNFPVLVRQLTNEAITVQGLKRTCNGRSTKVQGRDSHRIDSQTSSNYLPNLQWQFGKREKNSSNSYAATIIDYPPITGYPPVPEVEIDDPVYGFKNEEVKHLLQVAMQQSAEHQSFNRINWLIISIDQQTKGINCKWSYRSKIIVKELRLQAVPDPFLKAVEKMFQDEWNSEKSRPVRGLEAKPSLNHVVEKRYYPAQRQQAITLIIVAAVIVAAVIAVAVKLWL